MKKRTTPDPDTTLPDEEAQEIVYAEDLVDKEPIDDLPKSGGKKYDGGAIPRLSNN